MKKSLFVVALAVALVLAFSASAFAVGPFFLANTNTGQGNANYTGYLSWNYVKTTLDGVNNSGTPHGNYTTTTNKCQVCHAVHRASATGSVLTAIPGSGFELNTSKRTAGGSLIGTAGVQAGPNGYTKGCAWCHNIGGFATTVAMNSDGSLAPHSNCNRCHSGSPHGANVSEYPTLAAYLINEQPDLAITNDLASGNNALSAGMFDGTAPLWNTGKTLGTGYLCNGCHTGGSKSATGVQGNLAFAVNAPNATPAIAGEGATAITVNTATGHRVTALATTSWNLGNSPNAAINSFDPALPWKYNAFYTGQGFETGNPSSAPSVSQIAWAASNSCQSCHDQKLANGDWAFPHNYVSAAGVLSTATASVGGGYIWMNTSSDAVSAKTLLAKDSYTGANNMANRLLSEDGLCLKCHVKDASVGASETLPSAGAEGVGVSF